MIKKLLLGTVLALGMNAAVQAATVTKYFTFTYLGNVSAQGSFSYDDSIVGNVQGYNNLSDFSLRVNGPGSQRNFSFADAIAWNNYRHFGYNTVSNSFFGGNTTGLQGCCASYLMSAFTLDLNGGFGLRNGEIEASRPGVPGILNPFYDTITITNSAIPEPAVWTMMVTAFGLTGAVMRRRRMLVAA